MDVERLAMIGALVQLQNQNLLSLTQTDGKWRRKKRGDRVVLLDSGYREGINYRLQSKIYQNLYQSDF